MGLAGIVGIPLLLEKRQANNRRHTAWKQLPEEHLGHTVGRLFAYLRACYREAAFTETPLRTKELAVTISLPYPSAYAQGHLGELAQCQNSLGHLLIPGVTPHPLVELLLPIMLVSVPEW